MSCHKPAVRKPRPHPVQHSQRPEAAVIEEEKSILPISGLGRGVFPQPALPAILCLNMIRQGQGTRQAASWNLELILTPPLKTERH